MVKYIESEHPVTGDKMWRFNCSGLNALGFLPTFFEKHKHDEFSLSVFDTLSNDSTAEISDIPIKDMTPIIHFIYSLERADPIEWIGVNSLSKSYVVAMPLKRGKIKGQYKVQDQQLIFLGS